MSQPMPGQPIIYLDRDDSGSDKVTLRTGVVAEQSGAGEAGMVAVVPSDAEVATMVPASAVVSAPAQAHATNRQPRNPLRGAHPGRHRRNDNKARA
ncbi:MAG TPA: hypothetical protein VJ870_10415 [Amycolatopsis sp.]|nr:hypothetical protein [Amycolatopsis sp.]